MVHRNWLGFVFSDSVLLTSYHSCHPSTVNDIFHFIFPLASLQSCYYMDYYLTIINHRNLLNSGGVDFCPTLGFSMLSFLCKFKLASSIVFLEKLLNCLLYSFQLLVSIRKIRHTTLCND